MGSSSLYEAVIENCSTQQKIDLNMLVLIRETKCVMHGTKMVLTQNMCGLWNNWIIEDWIYETWLYMYYVKQATAGVLHILCKYFIYALLYIHAKDHQHCFIDIIW